MATPVATVTQFLAALGRSKLLSEADLRGVRAKWADDYRADDADIDGFRKLLVKDKYLTEYQAALIQRGREDGFLIGEYIVLDRIGSGQMAGVYKAIHKSGQVVALKVIPASKARDLHVLNRFQREGRLLTQLDHPNVVRAYQVGHASGIHFIVMEHLDGETLEDVLGRRKKLPYAEAVRLIVQAYRGLQHLNEKRLIHRDLKPANLMLVPVSKSDTLTATVKIVDIGLGRELFDDSGTATQDIQLTTEGAILGTPDYLAPEQARDARNADIRADIYSLGCVLYHAISGKPPFQDKNVMAQMVRHATEKPISISQLQPDVPSELSKEIDRLLAKKPEDRPATPAEAADFLSPFVPSKAAKAKAASVLPAYEEWLASESDLERPPELAQPKAIAAPVVPVPKKSAAIAKPSVTAPSPVTAKPRSATPVETVINVELVEPIEPSRFAPSETDDESRGVLDLDRRDWLMIGSGGVLMFAAIGLGYALTRFVKPRIAERERDEDSKRP